MVLWRAVTTFSITARMNIDSYVSTNPVVDSRLNPPMMPLPTLIDIGDIAPIAVAVPLHASRARRPLLVSYNSPDTVGTLNDNFITFTIVDVAAVRAVGMRW